MKSKCYAECGGRGAGVQVVMTGRMREHNAFTTRVP